MTKGQGLMFPDTPPVEDTKRMIAAFEQFKMDGLEPPRAKKTTLAIESTRYGLTVRVEPYARTMSIMVPRWEGDTSGEVHTFPLFEIFTNRLFLPIFSQWFTFFMAGLNSEPDSVPTKDAYYQMSDRVDKDGYSCTVISGSYPPEPGDRVWVFSIHKDYEVSGDTIAIVNRVVREIEKHGTKALQGKMAMLSYQEFTPDDERMIDKLVAAGATQKTLPGCIGDLVRWYYFAARAFLWIYAGLPLQAQYAATLTHPPDISTIWAFWEAGELNGNIPIARMLQLPGGALDGKV